MTELTRDLNDFRVVYTPGEEDKMRVYELTSDDFGYPYFSRRWDAEFDPESLLFRELFLKVLRN